MTFATRPHTVKRFDLEIQQLVDLVLEMGQTVALQVNRAVEAFRNGDVAAAQQVIAGDQAVNHLDMKIDRYCVRLLSRRQPMSTDLRLVMSLTKAVNDLERIGDEAKSIAEKTLAIQARGIAAQEGVALEVTRLASIANRQMQNVLTCFAQLDVEQAWAVVRDYESSEEVAFEDALRALSTYALDGQLMVGAVIDVALVLKALKRVTERSKNIAEYVIYIVEGQDVRHQL